MKKYIEYKSCGNNTPDKKEHLERRDFLKMAVLGASVLAVSGVPSFAGPFSYEELKHLVPVDKKLSKAWIKSLFERGKPEIYSSKNKELKYIGMPVGGIACGQLYLGGDGRLWLWHIFKTEYSREKDHGQRFAAMTLGGHYANPDQVFTREKRPVEQGVAIKIKSGDDVQYRTLDANGFEDITFRGEYPIGKVQYNDKTLPVDVKLEAFSPFIPLDASESALPVTVLEYEVKNTSDKRVEVELMAWLENAVVPFLNDSKGGIRRNTLIKQKGRTTIQGTAEALIQKKEKERSDIVFEDFESHSYTNWTAEGKAFGAIPFSKNELASWQPVKGYKGQFFVNSHNSRDIDLELDETNEKSQASDNFTGTLTSKTFTISRKRITFNISGGNNPEKTTIDLIIDGKVVRTATGWNSNQMRLEHFDVSEFEGKKAELRITDNITGGWGNIGIDHIVFTDSNPSLTELEKQHGFGSMALSVLGENSSARISFDVNSEKAETTFENAEWVNNSSSSITKPLGERLVSALGQTLTILPGDSEKLTFLITWFFPHLNQQENETGQLLALNDIDTLKLHYYNRFNSANQVADYVTGNRKYLISNTKRWNKVWYNSTLPYWLLDRSFIPIDCLATNTALWFNNGRFYGWEGVECCPGTCQHVWHYTQSMARIFPEFERYLRQEIDYGLSFREDGGMGHRDETAGGYGKTVAHDGHCGTIIRAYREHKMSTDSQFLRANYQKIKKSVQFMIKEDKDKDGILEGGQHNTLDASWYGPMGWISSLYIGALASGKAMAIEMGDAHFAETCNDLIQKGQKNIVANLFNGEYFIHKPDPNHPKAINSNDGCHIDQVLGQSLAFQAGVPERIIPEAETLSALKSIWKYNFAPDAFIYQEQHKPIKGARIYATAGEAGTIMCTWPKGGDETAVPGMDKRPDKSPTWLGPGGYFDECMNGFEYQLASQMINEGMLTEGLAITKSVHERYDAKKRNPFNEIECGDHYSRSMASYGVYIAICGFNYHGPKGIISFNPKVSPEDFKSAFTTAEGWGSFSQKRDKGKQSNTLELFYGVLKINSLEVHLKKGINAASIKVFVNGKFISSVYSQIEEKVIVNVERLHLKNNQKFEIKIQ